MEEHYSSIRPEERREGIGKVVHSSELEAHGVLRVAPSDAPRGARPPKRKKPAELFALTGSLRLDF